ncbi:verprolin-like [Oryza sativa Japonica Group]|uniref:verprolin-like n=1 Tax=Oryza sativa subsp. japonica TaxID=39947 RepID=UPI00339D1EA2
MRVPSSTISRPAVSTFRRSHLHVEHHFAAAPTSASRAPAQRCPLSTAHPACFLTPPASAPRLPSAAASAPTTRLRLRPRLPPTAGLALAPASGLGSAPAARCPPPASLPRPPTAASAPASGLSSAPAAPSPQPPPPPPAVLSRAPACL